MHKLKIIFSSIIFTILLIVTSTIKNETREIEKKIYHLNKDINKKEKDINETQLDFFYLSSPKILEEKLEHVDKNYYLPMQYSKIFLSISNFLELQNKFVIKEGLNEKKIQKR
tara:strand:- start:1099 stop:1437 length:339 start_codon:yes stop_codon:yes gene_type:complete